MELNKILHGNCLDVLKNIPDNSINCVITSPPYYGLRNYGDKTEIVFGGNQDCEHDWEKSICRKCQAWFGQLGLEPSIDLYIEHLFQIFQEIKRVLTADGTCFVNLNDSYSAGGGKRDEQSFKRKKGINTGAHPDSGPTSKLRYKLGKSLLLIPFRFAIKMVDNGFLMRNTIIWQKNNMLPVSCKDRYTINFEYIFFFVKNKKYFFEQQFEPFIKSNQNIDGTLMKNKRTIWNISNKTFRSAHFATYPQELVEEIIKAGCPPNGIVLDPFIGSGTTAIAAIQLKRNWIGIELNKEYIKIAEDRITDYKAKHRISLG